VIGELCIALVGIAGAVVLPTETITLSWTHTVEGTPWEEDYAIRDGALVLTLARVKRSGAGMHPPDGALWADDCANLIAEEIEKWAKVVRAGNIKPE
jgi:hypothetical protein